MAKVFELINDQQKYEKLLDVISNTTDLNYSTRQQFAIYKKFSKSHFNNFKKDELLSWFYGENSEYEGTYIRELCKLYNIGYDARNIDYSRGIIHNDAKLCIDIAIDKMLNINEDNNRAMLLKKFVKHSSEYVVFSRLGFDVSSNVIDFSIFSSLTEKEFNSVVERVNNISRSLIETAQSTVSKHDKAIKLIDSFIEKEYGKIAKYYYHDSIYPQPQYIPLVDTTITDYKIPVMVKANLYDCKIIYEMNGRSVKVEEYTDIEDMTKNGLANLDYDKLVLNVLLSEYAEEYAEMYLKTVAASNDTLVDDELLDLTEEQDYTRK